MQVDRGDQLPLGAHCRICNVVHLWVIEWLCHVDSSALHARRLRSAVPQACPRCSHHVPAMARKWGFTYVKAAAVSMHRLFARTLRDRCCMPGEPKLMMAFTADGQLNPALLEARDRRLGALLSPLSEAHLL